MGSGSSKLEDRLGSRSEPDSERSSTAPSFRGGTLTIDSVSLPEYSGTASGSARRSSRKPSLSDRKSSVSFSPRPREINIEKLERKYRKSKPKRKQTSPPAPPTMASALTVSIESAAGASVTPPTPAAGTPELDARCVDATEGNGLVVVYIKESLVRSVAKFVRENIGSLNDEKQLELAMLLFSHYFNTAEESRDLLIQYDTFQIAKLLLDGILWLFKTLERQDIDAFELVANLGVAHRDIGVSPMMYRHFLRAWDKALNEFFGGKYSIIIKNAFDNVLGVVTRLMTQVSLETLGIDDVSEKLSDLKFLTKIELCLRDPIGFALLSRFLENEVCPEYCFFLGLHRRFQTAVSDGERFMISREIVAGCVETDSPFELNISYADKQHFLRTHALYEESFEGGSELKIPRDLYMGVYFEVKRLVFSNYWVKFKRSVQKAQDELT